MAKRHGLEGFDHSVARSVLRCSVEKEFLARRAFKQQHRTSQRDTHRQRPGGVYSQLSFSVQPLNPIRVTISKLKKTKVGLKQISMAGGILIFDHRLAIRCLRIAS